MCDSGSVGNVVESGLTGGILGGSGGAMFGAQYGVLGNNLLGGLTPTVPAPPGLSYEERDLLRKHGVTLDQLNKILSGETDVINENRSLLRQFSGLYDERGNLNQDAVAGLRNKIQAQQGFEEGLNQQALQYLGRSLTPTELENLSGSIGVQEAQRYQQALSGNLPISEAQKQREKEQFDLLKEQAGSRGIRIEGDTVETATSESTAGNQLLSNLRKESNLTRENERNYWLTQGSSQNLARLGYGLQSRGQSYDIAQGLRSTPGSQSLNFLGQSFGQTPAQLFNAGLGLSQGYGQLTQPYQQQRYLGYQAQLQNAANRAGMWNNLFQLGGQLGTAALLA